MGFTYYLGKMPRMFWLCLLVAAGAFAQYFVAAYDTMWMAILPACMVAALIITDVLDRRVLLKENGGRELAATNNLLAILAGNMLMLGAWLEFITETMLKAALRTQSGWAILIGFAVLVATVVIHAAAYFSIAKDHADLIRMADQGMFRPWTRVRWLLEEFFQYGLFGTIMWFFKHILPMTPRRLKKMVV